MDISKHEVLTDLQELDLIIKKIGYFPESIEAIKKCRDISEKVSKLIDTTGTSPLKIRTLNQIKNETVIYYLRVFGNNRTKVAEAMGVSVRALRNWIIEMRDEGTFIPEPNVGNKEFDSDKVVELEKSLLDNNCSIDTPTRNEYYFKMIGNEERLELADNPERSLLRRPSYN